MPSESLSRALAAHAQGRRDQDLAAKLVEASATLVPTDEGGAAVAPWVTEPIPAGVLSESDVPLARRRSGSASSKGASDTGSAATDDVTVSSVEVPTVDTFIKSFGQIPHVKP